MSVSDEQVLVYLGAVNLYRKAVDIYTEAITNNVNVNDNLVGLFNTNDKFVGKDLDDTDVIFDFAATLSGDFKNNFAQDKDSNKVKSADFLKSKYDFYGVDYPPEGFLDVNYGPSNWWEKITQYNHGFFSYTHVFKWEPKTPGELKSSNGKIIGLKNTKVKFSELEFSPSKFKEDQLWNIDIRDELIEHTVARFVEENQNSQLNAVTIDVDIKQTYFLALNSGIKLKENADGSATVYVRTFFDTYGAKLALSLVKFTGLEPVPKIPSGVRKNFLVKNFLGGIDSVDDFFKELGTTNDKVKLTNDQIDLTLSQLKNLKSIFKKVVKDNKLSKDSTVAFLFSEKEGSPHNFLALLDGNNKHINSPELMTLLKNNVELNKTITYLNYINCQMGGNALPEHPESEEISFPFSLGSDGPSDEERMTQYNKLNMKSEFLGDVSLRSVLRAGAPKSVSAMYDQFFNKVDIHALSQFAISSLASKLSEEQLKKIRFDSYIESLDITEIIDCIIETVGDPYSLELKEGTWDAVGAYITYGVYDTFAFFYNAAKKDDPETFNFITEDAELPLKGSGGYDITTDFLYILMVPEEQKTKIFSTIANNNPQYMYNPQLIKYGMLEISKRDDFVPEKFITFALRRAVIKYAENLYNADDKTKFNNFYAEAAKRNKKLQGSFGSFDFSTDDFSSYKAQQGTNTKTNKSPSFDWFSDTTPTLNHTGFISELLEAAYEAAILTILSQIIDALVGGADKEMAGDPDKLDRADPAALPLIASNDPVANIIDSKNNNFNSPQDVFDHLASALFTPPQDPENVKCFLQAFASEVNFFTQAKLFKNPTKLNDPDIEIVRNILIKCGLPSDDSTIMNLLMKFSQLIDKDLLELKLKEMRDALLEYLDICIDPDENYLENLKKFLDEKDANSQSANEAAAAAQKLADLLALLDGDKIKNLAPNLFCKPGSNGQSVFDSQYSEVTMHNQDLMTTSFLKEINEKFNVDIDKFKPVVLKQDTDTQNPLAKLGIDSAGGDIAGTNFGKFLKKINDNELNTMAGQNSGLNLPENTTIIKDAFETIGDSLPFQQGSATIQYLNYNNTVFFRMYFGTMKYFMFINPNDEERIFTHYGGTPRVRLKPKSTSIFFYDTLSGDVVIPSTAANIKSSVEPNEPLESFDTGAGDLLNTFIKTFFDPSTAGSMVGSFMAQLMAYDAQAGKNIQLKLLAATAGWPASKWQLPTKDYPNLKTIPWPWENDFSPADTLPFIRSFFQNVISGIVTKLVSGTGEGTELLSQLFTDKNFVDIPLKDLEAANIFSDKKRFYRDNGLVSTPEIFEDFKNLRQNLQCYIEMGTTPDSYQVAKLVSLYQVLFNTLLIQQFLNSFFTFYTKDTTYGLSEEQAKAIILSDVKKRFNDNIFKIDNFHLNYKDDLIMIYKYEQLQNGYSVKSLFKKDKDGNVFLSKEPNDDLGLDYMSEEESIQEVIRYYVNKYFIIIKDKLNKRFDLVDMITEQSLSAAGQVFPKETTPLYSYCGAGKDINDWIPNKENKYKFKYTNTPIFVYNEKEIEFGKPGAGMSYDQNPYYMQIHNGLMVQTYFDIRQKLDVKEPFTLNKVHITTDDDGNEVATPIVHTNIPVANYLFHAWSFAYEDKIKGPSASEYKAKTNINLPYHNDPPPGNYGKVDMDPLDENNVDEDRFRNYKKYYLRTQGKISRQDFLAFYYKPSELPMGIDEQVDDIMAAQGPSRYYEKASVGARVCLVLDESDPVAKRIRDNIREYILANNKLPSLPDEELERQIKTIFNEKVFRYRVTYDSFKIVIPLVVHEFNALQQIQDEYDDNKKKHDDGEIVPNSDAWENWRGNLMKILLAQHDNVYANVLLKDAKDLPYKLDGPWGKQWVKANKVLVKDFQDLLPESMFDKILPLIIKFYLDKERPNLKDIFNPTVKEIIGQISLAKSVINKDWKSELTLTNESPFAPGSGIGAGTGSGEGFDDEFSYLPLILAALPTVIAAAATYSDPAWKTPWFFPGPMTPLGYLAKILNPL